MSIFQRHNINILGTGPETILFADGYGCDQQMWRFLVPAFQDRYRVVLFDLAGAGKSDLSQYTRQKYERSTDTLRTYSTSLTLLGPHRLFL